MGFRQRVYAAADVCPRQGSTDTLHSEGGMRLNGDRYPKSWDCRRWTHDVQPQMGFSISRLPGGVARVMLVLGGTALPSATHCITAPYDYMTT